MSETLVPSSHPYIVERLLEQIAHGELGVFVEAAW
jgi:hypothetical protein